MDTRETVTTTRNEPGDALPRPGNTSMQVITLTLEGRTCPVFLKMEGANPTGSVKDRTGYGLVRDLEERQLLRPGSVLIESTSGNLGVALAFLCAQRGYGFVAVVDPKTTAENLARMRELGASIDLVEHPDNTGGYLLSRLQRVRALCQQYPHYVWSDQYNNLANPLIHYQSTGPEIYAQMHGQVDALFVAVSTGGTLAGVGRYFREVSPHTRVIGVDARGSVIFGSPPAPRKLTGIGSSRPSSFLTPWLYDEAQLVSDEEAFAFCRYLAEATSLCVGGSSGATLVACARYLVAHPEVERTVCLCADRGEHYASSLYSDHWLQQHGITLNQEHLGPVREIKAYRSLQ